MKLGIKDKAVLVKIFKTISWLDSRRWDTEYNYNFVNFFRNVLTNSEKILTHWICYITDRQLPFEIVWDRGGYVLSELVYNYSRKKLSLKEILNNHYKKRDKDSGGKERFCFESSNKVPFASRFITDDYQSISQTLGILNNSKYDRSILVYIINIIQRFQSKNDLLRRVACGLHLLTYQLDGKKANPERIMKILNDDKQFEKNLRKFERTSTINKKRLWCCVRDYKKGLYYEIFKEAIKEIAKSDAPELIDIWNKLPMNQIELPGDVWNNSPLFRNNLFANVLDIDGIPKTWGMPKIIRELYDQLKNEKEVENFYPEQFDITFDFVPRMCNKKLCNVCLFGKNGVESICIPTQDKYCPVVLLSCGYVSKCEDQEKCMIKEGISKGICKGGLKRR